MNKLLGGLITILFFVPAVLYFTMNNTEARSGCCSWHGGVSYCDTEVGRYVCNDGTYSPSCTCYIEAKILNRLKEPTNPDSIWEIERARTFVAGQASDYYKNHNGFREKLILQMKNQFDLSEKKIGWVVYTFLQDVKY